MTVTPAATAGSMVTATEEGVLADPAEASGAPDAPDGATDGAPGGAPDDAAQIAYAWRVLSVTALGATLVGLNTSTLDVGLPSVVSHLHAGPAAANWILLSYMLVNTVLILVFGRVADLVGRRRLYLAGLAVLTLGSLGCGLAPNPSVLILMRVLAAAGGAAIITNTTAQLTDAFPDRMLSVGLGANITLVSAAQVAGPVVGGVLVTTLGWRWIFLFNVPVGVLGLLWARHTLRPGALPSAKGRLDVPGSLLTGLWLGGLVLALSEGGAKGWGSPLVVLGAALAIIGLPVFLVMQLRVKDPLVDLRLFADRARAMAYLAVFLMAVARFALVLLASLFVQAAQGLSALQAGIRVVPLALGIMAASPTAGRLANKLGARRLSTAGMLLSAAGLLVLVFAISPTMSYAILGPMLFVVGYGTGTFMTPQHQRHHGRCSAERTRRRQRGSLDAPERRFCGQHRGVPGADHQPPQRR